MKEIMSHEIVKCHLLEDIEDVNAHILANEKHLNEIESGAHWVPGFVPMYSFDYKIEKKKLKSLRKALKRVYNYYS